MVDNQPAIRINRQEKADFTPDCLVFGDNLTALRMMNSASVDLVYLDPPFNSGRVYHLLKQNSFKASQNPVKAYTDNWRKYDSELLLTANDQSSLKKLASYLEAMKTITGEDNVKYLTMLGLRLIELHRILKPSGSIYVHCDQNASSYIKILLDVVFGTENYLNSIVWCYGLGGSSNRRWPRKHDDIHWYSRIHGKQYFRAAMIPATSERMKGKMKKAPDYWMIPTVNNLARERTGYPTQKPQSLLERIILSSSPPDGAVLDPFCGSGTTLETASCLGRQWIGIDNSRLAIDVTRRRLGASLLNCSYRYITFNEV